MTTKKPPQEPINTTTHECNIIIFGIKRTVLKISPHYQKRNEEFHESKKKRIKENLNQYLLGDNLIKDFVQQLNNEKPEAEGINVDWPAWKYFGYEPVIDKRNGMAYRIIFFLDDDNPELIGVISVYSCE